MLKIPLTNDTEQFFNISILGVRYRCRVVWNFRVRVWTISFYLNGVPIVEGIFLVGGIDISQAYPGLPFKNLYIMNLEDSSADADVENLGTISNLILFTDEEVSLV